MNLPVTPQVGLRECLLDIPGCYQCFKSTAGGIRRYVEEFIRPQDGDRVLDIGCGTGDIVKWLGKVEYLGFDLSARYIENARRKYGSFGTFFCQRVGEDVAVEHGAFDLVLANGVLHHLPDNEALSLLRLARNALKPNGRLITLDGCFHPTQSCLARFILKLDRGKFVRKEHEYLSLASSVFPSIDHVVLNDLLRIPYTHLIMDCSAVQVAA